LLSAPKIAEYLRNHSFNETRKYLHCKSDVLRKLINEVPMINKIYFSEERKLNIKDRRSDVRTKKFDVSNKPFSEGMVLNKKGVSLLAQKVIIRGIQENDKSFLNSEWLDFYKALVSEDVGNIYKIEV